jgi:hypothetical protein
MKVCKICKKEFEVKGKQIYFKRMRRGSGNAFQLRRNIHRLEKGLCMKPQRNVFATDYIEDTVDNFIVLANGGADDFDKAQSKWAYGVLSQYFRTTGKHKAIDTAREAFNTFFHDWFCLEKYNNSNLYILI